MTTVVAAVSLTSSAHLRQGGSQHRGADWRAGQRPAAAEDADAVDKPGQARAPAPGRVADAVTRSV
jgi:hypothetical protein